MSRPAGEASRSYSGVFVANYSGVITCYDLLHHPQLDHTQQNLLIVQPFWLDDVHDQRLDSAWGQHVTEFPVHVRDLLIELFPDIATQERVTFRQIKALRAECVQRLKDSGEFRVIEGGVTRLERSEEGLLTVHSELEDVQTFQLAADARVYNFSQRARSDRGMPFVPSQTEVYGQEIGREPSRAIILGAGLSAVWFLEQTGERTQTAICIRNERSRIAPAISRNQGRTITREDCIRMDLSYTMTLSELYDRRNSVGYFFDSDVREQVEAQIAFVEAHGFNADSIGDNIIIVVENGTEVPKAVGHAYVAYGYMTDVSITEGIDAALTVTPDAQQRHRVERFFAPKNIPGDAGFARYVYLKTEVLGSRFSVYDIDIEALVITEAQKPLLSEAFGVPIAFIDYLCAEIRELEDTPRDPLNFIELKFLAWQAEAEERREIRPDFASLFEARARIHHRAQVERSEYSHRERDVDALAEPTAVSRIAERWQRWHELARQHQMEELQVTPSTPSLTTRRERHPTSRLRRSQSVPDVRELAARRDSFLEMREALVELRTRASEVATDQDAEAEQERRPGLF